MALLRPEEEAKAREWFAALERPVELLVALQAGSVVGGADDARLERSAAFGGRGPEETPLPGAQDVDFGAEAVRLAEGLADLGELVSVRVEDEPDGFPRFPAISVRPEGRDIGIRYDGLPWGYELGSLVGAILEAGKTEPSLRPESLEALGALDRDLELDVFVTPT